MWLQILGTGIESPTCVVAYVWIWRKTDMAKNSEMTFSKTGRNTHFFTAENGQFWPLSKSWNKNQGDIVRCRVEKLIPVALLCGRLVDPRGTILILDPFQLFRLFQGRKSRFFIFGRLFFQGNVPMGWNFIVTLKTWICCFRMRPYLSKRVSSYAKENNCPPGRQPLRGEHSL